MPDLVAEGDTLVVTHIDRLSRGLTYGLQVIEDLHLMGVEFRSWPRTLTPQRQVANCN